MHGQHTNGESIFSLVNPIEALSPELPLEEVALLFADARNAKLLSLPVVENGRPIGVISRYHFMNIYLKQYARELYGKRPLRGFINNTPLLVELDQPLTEAAQHVTANMQFPLTEDFIVTRHGRYLGIGFVMDLLKAMEVKMRANTTELEQAYSQLKSSQLALVQSEKMASLGQMVAGVAHEINTPLGYVQNNVAIGQELFSQMQGMLNTYEVLVGQLLDGDADEEQITAQLQIAAAMRNDMDAQEMLGEMNGLMADSLYGIEQISNLVLDLKNFSRMDAAANDLANLNDCIESALNIGRNVLKNKVEIVKDLGALPDIMCAPSQLNQVFLNLFTNAAQAMETQGTLYIKSWQDAESIHVSVSDNGKGIPPEIVSRIFDPFFTTKPVGEGTGLGLAITHQIIQQHGGDIQVESRVGEGTSFHINLPVGQHSTQPSAVIHAAIQE
ncbi:MAG: CBS domain-containing protein [Gammaproteobacteria bacterium]|nr:CBS domain-containing protein [Gammaproteobacteria bacterium]